METRVKKETQQTADMETLIINVKDSLLVKGWGMPFASP